MPVTPRVLLSTGTWVVYSDGSPTDPMKPTAKHVVLAAEFETIAVQLLGTTDPHERAVILEEMRAILQEAHALIASRLPGSAFPA